MDPVETLIRPHQERTEPDRLTHSHFSAADGTMLAKDRHELETPRMKAACWDTLKRNPERRNDMTERTLDATCLRPNDNDQSGHTLVDLTTGARITRHKIRP